MPEIPEAVAAWAAKPGPARFLDALRIHLERGGKAQGMLRFQKDPLSIEEQLQLGELFGIREKVVTAGAVNLRLVRRRLEDLGIELEDLDLAVNGPLVTRSESKQERDARKLLQVARRRFNLVAVMLPHPEFARERELLLNLPLRPAHQVPPESATGTAYWFPYDAAIRSAAAWNKWRLRENRPIPEGTLLNEAFGNVKSERMAAAGRNAFENLVGDRYDVLVERAESEIRLRGPLVWVTDDPAVNANVTYPWVSVPAKSIRNLGRTSGEVDGVLLVENQETFQQICQQTTVAQRWLCIWGQGFASDDLIEFVKLYRHLPVAACCDLDPPGIGIVEDLSRRLGFTVTPVGMSADAWRRSKKMVEAAERREIWAAEAAALEDTCHASLRPLAAAIAETGERVEQEAMELYWELIETIPEQLRALLN